MSIDSPAVFLARSSEYPGQLQPVVSPGRHGIHAGASSPERTASSAERTASSAEKTASSAEKTASSAEKTASSAEKTASSAERTPTPVERTYVLGRDDAVLSREDAGPNREDDVVSRGSTVLGSDRTADPAEGPPSSAEGPPSSAEGPPSSSRDDRVPSAGYAVITRCQRLSGRRAGTVTPARGVLPLLVQSRPSPMREDAPHRPGPNLRCAAHPPSWATEARTRQPVTSAAAWRAADPRARRGGDSGA